jgi:plasmid stability protein
MLIQRRSRLVSFRMSEEEYSRLRTRCATAGVRSISDLARNALARLMEAENSPDGDGLAAQVRALSIIVEDLRRQVNELSGRLRAAAPDV